MSSQLKVFYVSEGRGPSRSELGTQTQEPMSQKVGRQKQALDGEGICEFTRFCRVRTSCRDFAPGAVSTSTG